jgi:transcriptional regulator with XRE-family HTH domain
VVALRAEPSVAARALEFLVLTAARTDEIIGPRWEEVDLADPPGIAMRTHGVNNEIHSLLGSLVRPVGGAPTPPIGRRSMVPFCSLPDSLWCWEQRDNEMNGRPNPIDEHVGSRLKMRRLMLDMSQTAVGDAVGVTFQQIQKYERGVNRLVKLSGLLQVPIPFFFEGAPAGLNGDLRATAETAASSADVNQFLSSSAGLALARPSRASKARNCAVPSLSSSSRSRKMSSPAVLPAPFGGGHLVAALSRQAGASFFWEVRPVLRAPYAAVVRRKGLEAAQSKMAKIQPQGAGLEEERPGAVKKNRLRRRERYV